MPGVVTFQAAVSCRGCMHDRYCSHDAIEGFGCWSPAPEPYVSIDTLDDIVDETQPRW